MPLSVKQGDPCPALNTRHSSLFSHPTPGVWGAGKSRFRSEAASQTRFFRASAGPALLSAAHSTARLQARLGARGRCVPGTSPVGRWFQPPAPPPDSRPCLFRSANALSPPRASGQTLLLVHLPGPRCPPQPLAPASPFSASFRSVPSGRAAPAHAGRLLRPSLGAAPRPWLCVCPLSPRLPSHPQVLGTSCSRAVPALCPVPHTAGSSRPSGLAFGGPSSEGHPTVPLKRVRAREAGGAAGVQENPCILSAPKTALLASRRVGPPRRAAPEAAGHQLAVPQFHSGPTPSPGN